MGLSLADLAAVAPSTVTVTKAVTVADYVPVVASGYDARTRRTYNSYWRLMVELLGDSQLHLVTADDVLGVAEEATRRAKLRRRGSNGRASRESCIAAMRAVFTRAQAASLVPTNPALLVDKPRRLPNRRRALSQAELDELWSAVAATTRDPQLDLLLLRFHLESGARRIGAINLRRRDLDPQRQTLWLREKFGIEREQPISRSLLDLIIAIADDRGSTGLDDPVFRTLRRRKGTSLPLTDRTYDRIFTNAQQLVPWAARTPLTAHVLRHTAVRAVERLAGPAVARAFAGHGASSVTDIYTKADIAEVAAAVAELTGEPHPLAAT